MKLLFGSAQDIGKRKEQQDDFYVSDPCRTDGSNPGLLVVCDGIGGLPCGKEAAQITCDAVKNSIMSEKRISDIHGALLKSLRDANRALLDFIVSKGKVMECGCTLVAAALQDDMLFWISAGDSHIYHISGKSITQLNEDHTYGKVLDAAVARGDIDKSIADKHSKKRCSDKLCQLLGGDESLIRQNAHFTRRFCPAVFRRTLQGTFRG